MDISFQTDYRVKGKENYKLYRYQDLTRGPKNNFEKSEKATKRIRNPRKN